jgi:GNAT superfamily N-acetyltransferase
MRDAVIRAALFPIGDIVPPPVGRPERLVEVAGVRVLVGSGMPMGSVFPENIPAAELRAVVEEVRVWLRAEGRTTGVWFVPKIAEPAGLAQRLQELGLVRNESPPFEPRYANMVAVEAPPSGPSDVEVRRVGNIEDVRLAGEVAARAFGMDAETAAAYEARAELIWQFESEGGARATFLATVDGEAAGFAGASFGKSAVYFGGSGTDPDFRGRGIYRALVRARWDAAVERGTPALTVGAGAMSRPILERLAFSIVGWEDCLRDDLTASMVSNTAE